MVSQKRREYKRDWMRQWRAENPGQLYADTKPFAGVDGEGGTVTGGTGHDYFILRAGESVLTNPVSGRLTSEQCLGFLADLPNTHHWVAFFFDYDVTKILADLPFERVHRLLHRELRIRKVKGRPTGQTYPIEWNGFEIDYLPRKEFRVRRIGGKWTIISDVGSFFQKAFAEVIETWGIGTPEQREAIAQGKAARNRFDISEIANIDRYNHLECRLLAELMENFRAVCKRAGYVPRKWQGPGLIAEEMMRVHGIPPSRDVPLLKDPRSQRLIEFAQNAFYGGRPEITVIGRTEPCHQWDINSAYPFALLHVPCLVHGHWDHWRGDKLDREDLALVYGHFKPKPGTQNVKLWGLPVRKDNGTIHYPAEGWGWYWSFEIEAAVHQEFIAAEGFTYSRLCFCRPFDWIPDIYAMRVRLGKDTLGYLLKLALNSLYGKIAQSIGSPKYANPIWASFITAYCRTMVQELIHMGAGHKRGRCGEDVLMVATDAVFTTSDLPITDSKELGGYSLTEWDQGIFIVQPGMYYGTGAVKPKTRGVPRNRMEELRPDFFAAFSDMWNGAQEALDPFAREDMEAAPSVPIAAVTVPLKTFVGLRLAVHRRKLEIAGTWIGCECIRSADHKPECVPWEKEISFDPTSKRRLGFPKWSPTGAAYITTFPHIGSPDLVTVPYDKNIGGLIEREERRMDFYDQPDWASVLEPPEQV